MKKQNQYNIITVGAENVDQTGFFCYMSKPKSEGYKNKLNWLKDRFAEGMRIKMFELPNRGFIEYIPGEYAWRAVNAEGYMFIHCLWIVGKSKKKGLAGHLLNECIREVKDAGMNGVAMVTSEHVWLMGKKLLLKHGFESAEEQKPFNIMVKKFKDVPAPSFCGNFEQKANKFSEGFTVIYSDQCPYIPDSISVIQEFAAERGMKSKVVKLESCEDVREITPSPYGLFSVVYNGKLLAYHYLLPKDLVKIFGEPSES